VGRDRVDRRRPEDRVGERLGEHATDAEHHGRAELFIPREPDHQLAGPPDQWRDEERHRAVVNCGRSQ
jgi:hypothetical protein